MMFDINDFSNFIALHPLPGEASQFTMAPLNRERYHPDNKSQNSPRDSSVLILIYPADEDYQIVFVQRHQYNGVHSNQVSLPGGKVEASDRSLYDTALRETKEELGINPQNIQYIGKLTPLYVPPSNYLIHPFIGFLPERPKFQPDAKEVREIFEVSFSEIFDNHNIKRKEIRLSDGKIYQTPCFVWQGYIVWGATAMIMAEFTDVLKNFLKTNNLFDVPATKQKN